MAKKTKPKIGRPKLEAGKAKGRFLQVRLQTAEAEDFSTAANLAGVPSTWVRERLRIIARKELGQHGMTPEFLKKQADGQHPSE